MPASKASFDSIGNTIVLSINRLIMFLKKKFVLCPSMEINISVQYNGEPLPDIILYYSVDPMVLTLGNLSNLIKIFSSLHSQCSFPT